jgi:long-chain acyl-CoA synthetase
MGDWAERNGISYASYQELAGLPQVYDIVQRRVEQVNRDLAADSDLAGAQIRRFLVLHKQLDADDGELTRTRKVRRRHVSEKYGSLIEALYSGQDRCGIETEVTFEDGRKGTVRADLRIQDVAPTEAERSAA